MAKALTTRSLKMAALFDTEKAAEAALERYVETARLVYGPRVWMERSIDKPVYSGSQHGWLVPIKLHESQRTVWLTEAA